MALVAKNPQVVGASGLNNDIQCHTITPLDLNVGKLIFIDSSVLNVEEINLCGGSGHHMKMTVSGTFLPGKSKKCSKSKNDWTFTRIIEKKCFDFFFDFPGKKVFFH